MVELVEEYERLLRRQGKAEKTLRTYHFAWNELLAFLQRAGVDLVGEVRERHLELWQDELLGRGVSASTRNVYAAAVRGFFHWCARRRLVDAYLEESIVAVHQQRGRPRPLPASSIDALVAQLAHPSRDLVRLRNRALFFYLVGSSARVSEVLQLRRDDYRQPVVVQKGGSQKQLRVPGFVLDYVAEYVAARRDPLPWLWVTLDRNREMRQLTAGGVRDIWISLTRQLGIPRFTTHQLRHTTATFLQRAGVSPLVMAEYLGHHGLQTLQVYAGPSDEQLEHAADVVGAALLAAVPVVRAAYLKPLKKRKKAKRRDAPAKEG